MIQTFLTFACAKIWNISNLFLLQVQVENEEAYVPCSETHQGAERKSINDIPNHLLRVQFNRVDFLGALAGRKSSVTKNDKTKVENIERELCWTYEEITKIKCYFFLSKIFEFCAKINDELAFF